MTNLSVRIDVTILGVNKLSPLFYLKSLTFHFNFFFNFNQKLFIIELNKGQGYIKPESQLLYYAYQLLEN